MKNGEKYFEGRVSLKALIVSPNGKILICKNHQDRELWDLPGGTMNVGEAPEEGVLREIKEELGISPVLRRPLKADIFTKPKTGKRVFVLTYEAFLPEETTDFMYDESEISEARWIGKEDLRGMKLFPEYHRIVEEYFARKNA